MKPARRIKRFLREHRVWISIVALGVLIAFTGWHRLTVDETVTGKAQSAMEDTDYVLRDFTLTMLNEQGEIDVRLIADTMRHHPSKKRSEYVQPHLILFENGAPHWRGRAARAWARDSRREIVLIDDVELQRGTPAAGGALTIQTQRLHLYPEAERATSRVRVHLSRSDSNVHGTGMRFDFKDGQYTLKADVQGSYEISRAT